MQLSLFSIKSLDGELDDIEIPTPQPTKELLSAPKAIYKNKDIKGFCEWLIEQRTFDVVQLAKNGNAPFFATAKARALVSELHKGLTTTLDKIIEQKDPPVNNYDGLSDEQAQEAAKIFGREL